MADKKQSLPPKLPPVAMDIPDLNMRDIKLTKLSKDIMSLIKKAGLTVGQMKTLVDVLLDHEMRRSLDIPAEELDNDFRIVTTPKTSK